MLWFFFITRGLFLTQDLNVNVKNKMKKINIWKKKTFFCDFTFVETYDQQQQQQQQL